MRNFFTDRGLRAGVRKLSLALGAIAALCCLSSIGLAKAQTAPITYSVYPVPGTLTASTADAGAIWPAATFTSPGQA